MPSPGASARIPALGGARRPMRRIRTRIPVLASRGLRAATHAPAGQRRQEPAAKTHQRSCDARQPRRWQVPQRQPWSGEACWLPFSCCSLGAQPRGGARILVGGKNCHGQGPGRVSLRYCENLNNSATQATIYKRIGVRESLREELSHTPVRL